MKYLKNIFIIIFSVGILILPTQSVSAQIQNDCCTSQSACHKDIPKKERKSSNSTNCCNVSVCAFQFINSAENLSSKINKEDNFKEALSFFHYNELISNAYLEGIWQPPKFI